jgi:LysR family transcriptional regulator, hydrogen peroxide-inducible genes activator
MDVASTGSRVLPTLRQLHFLTALKAHGGFVRAADAVGVTQPTLSAGIKELEELLGVSLVDRSRTGAVLTEAGEEAARRAAGAIADVEDLVRAVRRAGAPLAGAFRLGAIPTIAPFLLPNALATLKARFPQLRLILKEDVTSRLVDALKARTLDAAIIALPYAANGIDVDIVAEDEFLLACPAGHPLARQDSVSPDSLVNEDVLLLEDGHCLRDHAQSVCRVSQSQAAAEVGATSLHTLVQMVGGGLGVTLLPRLAEEAGVTAGANVAIRRFDPPVIGRLIGIAWRAGGLRSEEAKLIAETLRAGRLSGPRDQAD